ncbi:hypothetical protein ES703_49603 [subsurface metagenome]
MVKRFIRADITTPVGAPRIDYPMGWYENVEKIFVAAYDDPNRKCVASLDDDALFDSLMATGRVEELTEADFMSEVARLRPPPPEVAVKLAGKGKDHRVAIEALLQTKGVTYRIEER